MKAILVEDEQLALDYLERKLVKIGEVKSKGQNSLKKSQNCPSALRFRLSIRIFSF